MNESLITVRYAKALYNLTSEIGKQDEILDDIRLILECINYSEELKFLLETPQIRFEEKYRLIKKLFDGNINTYSLNFIQLLIRNKRESYLKNICYYYIYYHKTRMGIQEAEITTARPLKNEHRNEILQYISKQLKTKIELSEKIDPKIIGGFILQIENQQINASLSSQLEKIKRELINK